MLLFMSPSTVKSERRRKSRNRPLSLVYVELPSGNGGMMRDLSEEGFAIRAMLPLRAGEHTPFSFSLNESVHIDGEAKILWVEENGRVAGVRFTQISSVARALIHDWLSRPQDSPKAKELPTKPAAPAASTLQQLREEIRSVPPREDSPETIHTMAPPAAPETLTSVLEGIAGAPTAEHTSEPDRILPGSHDFVLGGKTKAVVHENLSNPPEVPVPPRPDSETVFATSGVAPKARASKITSLPEMLLPGLRATVLGDTTKAPAPEISGDTPAEYVAPPIPKAPDAVESSFEPLSLAPKSHRDAPFSEGAPSPPPPSAMSGADVEPPLADPALPDISEILIQPSRHQNNYSQYRSVLEPLTIREREAATSRASWLDHFTLSPAVTIMLLLTLFAAVLAFHSDVGQSLIWLGEQMGGTQVSQLQSPPSNVAGSDETPIEPSSGPASSASEEGTTATPKAQGHVSAPGTASPGNDSQAPLPSAARNTPLPVAPLSDLSTSSSSTPGQESGQSEYLQAMQILRTKNAGANTSEVVRLLWASVEKGNPSAELALADVYWYGQGVARNCDQTRILLSAAARKGSAEAQKRLRQFQRDGCE